MADCEMVEKKTKADWPVGRRLSPEVCTIFGKWLPNVFTYSFLIAQYLENLLFALSRLIPFAPPYIGRGVGLDVIVLPATYGTNLERTRRLPIKRKVATTETRLVHIPASIN